MKTPNLHSLLRLALLAPVAGFLSVSSQAATKDYTGANATTTAAFAAADNWTPSVPVNDLTTDIARFNLTSYVQPTLTSAGRSLNGLIFGDGTTSTADITITITGASGQQLKLGDGGIVMNANSGNATINKVQLGANQTWTNNSDNLLSVGTLGNTGNVTAFVATFNGTGKIAITGVVSDNGTVGTTGLNISGATVTLGGANTFTGDTVVTSGSLTLGNANALASSTLNTTGSATINFFAGTNNIGALKGSGNIDNGGNLLRVGANTQNTTYSGNISGAGGLTLATGGVLTLSGVNTFTGNVTVGSGINTRLFVSSDANLGNGSTVTINQNGRLTTTASMATNKNFVLTGGSPKLDVAAGTTFTINGTLSGPSTNPAKTSNGDLVLNGANSFATDTVFLVSAGGLAFGNAAALNAATLKYNGGDRLDNTSGSPLTATGMTGFDMTVGFTFTGSSSLDLSGAQAGFVQTVDSVRTLTVSANTLTLSGILSTGTAKSGARVNGGLIKAGAGTLVLADASDYTLGTTINTGTLQIGNGGTTGSLSTSSAITNNATLAFKRSNTVTQGVDFATVVSGTGNFVQDGTGNLILATGNTYSGNTTVNGGGTGSITIGDDSALGTAPGAATAASLVLNNGGLVTTGTMVLNSNRGILLSGPGGEVNVNAGTTTYGGIIAGTGFRKSGTGILLLTGANTYTGATQVSAGKLVINGDNSAATGAMTVDNGASLGGNGTIGGATTIDGTHTPGNSPGLQTFVSDLTYGGNATFVFELISNATATRGTDFDGVDVGGALSITSGAAFNITLNGAGSTTDFTNVFWASNQTWLVFSGATGGSGNFVLGTVSLDSLGQNYSAYGSFNTSRVGNDIQLNWVAVPEPAAWLLAAFGLTTVVVFRRRRQD